MVPSCSSAVSHLLSTQSRRTDPHRSNATDTACTMAATRRFHSNGIVLYTPEDVVDSAAGSQHGYRSRQQPLGRVRIKAITPSDSGALRQNRFSWSKRSRTKIYVKVAVARDTAKKILRSVISSNNAAPSESADVSDSRLERRSWSPTKRSQSGDATADHTAAETTTMRGANRNSISGLFPGNQHIQRPQLDVGGRNGSVVSAMSADGSPSRLSPSFADNFLPAMDPDEKALASGNGVSAFIHLAEPVLFLQGFTNNDTSSGNTAMLRGSLHLKVQKSAKIKSVSLKFKGKAVTKWPEGIPPRKVDFEETDTIMSHTWPFFNSQFESAERGTNADHVQLSKGPEASVTRLDALGRLSPNASSTNISSKEAKKLSLAVNQSRSFGKSDPAPGSSIASKGYRLFLPGDYIYSFELPLDSRLPETIDVELGTVKYELEAVIERAGAFRGNLQGSKEVTLIRAPSEGSLEQVEPIAISRNWEDQLHYDIVISGKSFPLGSQVPIAFKLTPLAKVQCHRIKVLVTENIEYFCSNKRVHRMEPIRKVQLFEKRADGPPVSTFPGSTMRIISGGGVPYDQRAAAMRGEHVTGTDSSNLLGNLSDQENATAGPTEMEFSVQLPSCHSMKERERHSRLHFDTTHQNIQVHHWIKIVMRLSKPDPAEPGKRRHFEISIDSPFHILSCRATQANTSLPAYSSPQGGMSNGTSLYECGCPGAARRKNSPTSFVPTLNALNSARAAHATQSVPDTQSPGLARPQQAHIHGGFAQDRPMHLLRAPSFNPPAFEAEDPPPPLITPPPQYNDIASPTHGLADYFSRLTDAYESDDDDDSSHVSGRVNVPLTPGGRVNRSMDLARSWVPVGR
nr:putative arrestin-related trafficking adapter c2d10.04 [Quercus suber]